MRLLSDDGNGRAKKKHLRTMDPITLLCLYKNTMKRKLGMKKLRRILMSYLIEFFSAQSPRSHLKSSSRSWGFTSNITSLSPQNTQTKDIKKEYLRRIREKYMRGIVLHAKKILLQHLHPTEQKQSSAKNATESLYFRDK